VLVLPGRHALNHLEVGFELVHMVLIVAKTVCRTMGQHVAPIIQQVVALGRGIATMDLHRRCLNSLNSCRWLHVSLLLGNEVAIGNWGRLHLLVVHNFDRSWRH
jgi:hypothetical protein